MNTVLRTCGQHQKEKMMKIRGPEGTKSRVLEEGEREKTMAETLPNRVKDINAQIREAQ